MAVLNSEDGQEIVVFNNNALKLEDIREWNFFNYNTTSCQGLESEGAKKLVVEEVLGIYIKVRNKPTYLIGEKNGFLDLYNGGSSPVEVVSEETFDSLCHLIRSKDLVS